jgi:hypothetical protein
LAQLGWLATGGCSVLGPSNADCGKVIWHYMLVAPRSSLFACCINPIIRFDPDSFGTFEFG